MKLSRRNFLWGSTALVAASALPAANPGPTPVVWYAGQAEPPLFIYGESPAMTALDLRPGAVNWGPRTARDDMIDFGTSFEIDGRRIPPEDWPEDFYDRKNLEGYWENVKDWKSPSGLHLDTSTMRPL